MAACLGLIKQHSVWQEQNDVRRTQRGIIDNRRSSPPIRSTRLQRSHLAVPHFEKDVDQVFWLFFPPDLLVHLRRVHDKSHLVQSSVPLEVRGQCRVYVCANLLRQMFAPWHWTIENMNRTDRMQNHRRHLMIRRSC